MTRAEQPEIQASPPVVAGIITARSASAPTSAVITYNATSLRDGPGRLVTVTGAQNIGRQFLPATNVQYTPANIGDPCLLVSFKTGRMLWAFTERVETEACAESA